MFHTNRRNCRYYTLFMNHILSAKGITFDTCSFVFWFHTDLYDDITIFLQQKGTNEKMAIWCFLSTF